MTYDDLKLKISYLDEADQKMVQEAFEFANKAHEGQVRRTGEPFIEHSLQTASFIADLKLDAEALSAALLHDVCEDTPHTTDEIKKNFNRNVANLVDGVTKLGKIRIVRKWLFITNEKELKEFDQQVENLRKMFVAMAKDIRVILIKLADRLHNMKTLEGIEPNKRLRIAKETLEIYAPLAYRLGMGEVKGQLEDLSFPYVYPKEYDRLKEMITNRLSEKEKYIENIKYKLLKKLAKVGIRAEINGRTKHMYSLWRKLLRYDNDLTRIYDLVAIRIIVGNIEESYKVLGIIHEMWKPLVGRIKDYIAMPKPNGYQSLHTTVFADEGEILEVQIRTREMHDQAENGIAAHWHYSEKKNTFNPFSSGNRVPKQELEWVSELNKWQKLIIDNKEITDRLSTDFFSKRIFVYTPQGDVKNLPLGATPIDFAYAVHTDIGNKIFSAKVNGKMIELSHHLQNGDIVEIETKKSSHPKHDWLEFAKTSLARSRIKSFIKGKS